MHLKLPHFLAPRHHKWVLEMSLQLVIEPSAGKTQLTVENCVISRRVSHYSALYYSLGRRRLLLAMLNGPHSRATGSFKYPNIVYMAYKHLYMCVFSSCTCRLTDWLTEMRVAWDQRNAPNAALLGSPRQNQLTCHLGSIHSSSSSINNNLIYLCFTFVCIVIMPSLQFYFLLYSL